MTIPKGTHEMMVHAVEMIRIGYKYGDHRDLTSGLARLLTYTLTAMSDLEPDEQKEVLMCCIDSTMLRTPPDATTPQLWDIVHESICPTTEDLRPPALKIEA